MNGIGWKTRNYRILDSASLTPAWSLPPLFKSYLFLPNIFLILFLFLVLFSCENNAYSSRICENVHIPQQINILDSSRLMLKKGKKRLFALDFSSKTD